MDPIFVLPSSAPMGKNNTNIALELGRRFFLGFGFWKNETFYFLKLLLPGKLTCPLKINGWKMYFLLK